MVRMGNVYMSEGNIENAYILYIKFMTLFIEKIKSHPEYKTTPASLKQPNIAKLKEIMPVTEKLKLKLLDRYQKEYTQYLANKETERQRELERAKDAEKRNKFPSIVPPQTSNGAAQPTAPDLSTLLDQVVYPNDFPSDNNRSNLPGSGLLLPDNVTDKKPSGKPSIDRNLKPSSNLLSDGGFRTVIVPGDTMRKFLDLANNNTVNNVETCGILAGNLAHNCLLITHVILPKQKGTSDSCNTMNEEELFDIQDQHNLITLGWIHVRKNRFMFHGLCDLN